MKDYEILKKIEHISTNNQFLSYIVDRVQDDNYRGTQCSQHNRLTYDYFRTLLQVIHEKAGNDIFRIHVGDDNGERQPEAITYYEIVREINERIGKGTINSVKKNTFPDLARAGFLDRYDKDGHHINESFSIGEYKPLQKRIAVYSVGLSVLGLNFILSKTEFERRKYYTDAVDILTKNAATDMVELLSTDNRFDYINILEFMYILSDDRENIYFNDKLMYLVEYRRLTETQRNNLNKLLQMYCNPQKPRINKSYARDYHNWKNESQQIYKLLNNSTYFKVIDDNLILNDGQYGLFVQSAQRSQKPKEKYFRYHNIKHTPNYELHHIIPFKRANNQQEAQYIDDERNMIYLSSQKHAEFTKSQNVNIRTSYSIPNILFLKLGSIDQIITVNLDNREALLSVDKIDEIINYNKILLQKFYQAVQ